MSVLNYVSDIYVSDTSECNIKVHNESEILALRAPTLRVRTTTTYAQKAVSCSIGNNHVDSLSEQTSKETKLEVTCAFLEVITEQIGKSQHGI